MPSPEKGPEQQHNLAKHVKLTARQLDEMEERSEERRKSLWRTFGYDDPFDWKTPWEEEFEL